MDVANSCAHAHDIFFKDLPSQHQHLSSKHTADILTPIHNSDKMGCVLLINPLLSATLKYIPFFNVFFLYNNITWPLIWWDTFLNTPLGLYTQKNQCVKSYPIWITRAPTQYLNIIQIATQVVGLFTQTKTL